MTSKNTPDDLSQEEISKLLELKRSMAELRLDHNNTSAKEICRLFGLSYEDKTVEDGNSKEDNSMEVDGNSINFRIPKNRNTSNLGSRMDYISPLAKVAGGAKKSDENMERANQKFRSVRRGRIEKKPRDTVGKYIFL